MNFSYMSMIFGKSPHSFLSHLWVKPQQKFTWYDDGMYRYTDWYGMKTPRTNQDTSPAPIFDKVYEKFKSLFTWYDGGMYPYTDWYGMKAQEQNN